MSRIRANNIVNGAGTGAPTFPNGAIISGIATVNADIDSNSNLTANQITSLQSIGVGTGATVTNPADNELAFNTNGVERVRVDSSGNVGIGTDEPTKALHLSQNSDVAIRLQARNANVDNTSWEIVVGGNASNDAEMIFRTRNDAGTGGSEIARFTTGGDLKFPSGGGIDFSATSDGSGTSTSEVLDDYEEGSFTPSLSSSAAFSWTAGSGNIGYYTKVGNLVTVCGTVVWTNFTYAGTLYLDGFPYTSTNLVNYRVAGTFGGSNSGMYCPGSYDQLGLAIDPNMARAFVLAINYSITSGTNYTHQPGVPTAGSQYGFFIQYMTQ